MIDYKMLKYSPSHLVATAVLAALRILRDPTGQSSSSSSLLSLQVLEGP